MTRFLLAVLLLVPTFGWAAGNYSSSNHSPAAAWLSSYESTATVSLNASTYTTYTGWDVDGGYSTGASVITTRAAMPSRANAIWILPQGPGLYEVRMSMSTQCQSACEIHCDVHKNNLDTEIGFRQTYLNASTFGGGADDGILRLVDGDSLTIRCIAAADETLNAENASLIAVRIGP